MPIRPFIATFLWLTYALLLGHDLLPHHHHEGTEFHPDVHHTHQHDADHDSDEDEPDWWFTHQHSPGVISFQIDAPTVQVVTGVAVLLAECQLPVPIVVDWPGQTVGWPPTQSKAPPGQHRFLPLRAPPISSLTA